MNRHTVLVIDDHPLVRAGLRRMLADDPQFAVVGEGACAIDAIRLYERLRPDVMILDLNMPGGGMEVLRAVSSQDSATNCIVLSAHDEASLVANALTAGASHFIPKAAGLGPLRDAMAEALESSSAKSAACAKEAKHRAVYPWQKINRR